MKIISFSVSKYRSITSAKKLPISEMTVLIGPNNEGKSNAINALATAIALIRLNGRARPSWIREVYDWERDFPIGLQDTSLDGASVFTVEFELEAYEITEFKAEVGSDLNGVLPIQITIGRAGTPKFKVLKKGPGGTSLSNKGTQVAEFISKRFEFSYIPAIRTTDKAMEVVSDMLSEAFREIENTAEYQAALSTLAQIQQPILDQLSGQIASALKQFIPQVKSAEVKIAEVSRNRALRRSFEIIIDDGIPTTIERKGDGIKSLAAISLLRGVHQSIGSSLLALEEPESHLHPGAIHLLKPVIDDLAKHHQVVLTTHCPLFVDRVNIGRNILVTNNEAKVAKKISEVREILGIKASDNLLHANVVLIVEGAGDQLALGAVLSHLSSIIDKAFASNTLVIETLNGAHKLTYKCSTLKAAICEVHAFLDNDQAGKSAIDQSLKEGVLSYSEYTLCTCPGMKESELEDLYDPHLYRQLILDEFNVDIICPEFTKKKGKWSDRMERLFHQKGVGWNDGISISLKGKLADHVAANPDLAIFAPKREALNSLIEKLERALSGGK